MKLNPIIIGVVIILAVYIGLNLPNNQGVTSLNDKIEQTVDISENDQKEQFIEFYNYVSELINTFKEIDQVVIEFSGQNPSKIQAYESFNDLKKFMEEGQRLPLSTLIPNDVSEEHEEIYKSIVRDLSNTFQYRKFAYENFIDFLETDSLKSNSDALAWKESADHSLTMAILNIEWFKLEYGLTD